MSRRIIYRNYHWFDPAGEHVFLLSEPPRALNVLTRSLRSSALEGRENPRTGERVYLRVCRLPSGIGTTVEEYRRFLSRMNCE